MSTSEIIIPKYPLEVIVIIPTLNNQFKTTVTYSCTNPTTFIGGEYETNFFLTAILKNNKELK